MEERFSLPKLDWLSDGIIDGVSPERGAPKGVLELDMSRKADRSTWLESVMVKVFAAAVGGGELR